MATRSLGGGIGLLHRRCRHARDEPADNDDTVSLVCSVLHRGGSVFRPDGPGGLVCGYGRGSAGIIRDRVLAVLKEAYTGNPEYAAGVRTSLRKVRNLAVELGLVTRVTKPIWKAFGIWDDPAS